MSKNHVSHISFRKRLFDIALGAPLVLVALPVLVLLATIVRLRLGSPVLFRQIRPGLGEKLFTIYKFRTMTNARDAKGNLLPDSQRVTPLGSFLRRSSLDELPELLNVLKGDMSFVGPRPLLTQYLPYYTERERLRFTVRPGITGWSQVNGRNELPWNQRFAMDVWYIERWSIGLDLRILWLTAGKVITSEGVMTNTESTEAYLDQERATDMHRLGGAPSSSRSGSWEQSKTTEVIHFS